MGYFVVKGRVLTVMRLTSRLSLFRENWALYICSLRFPRMGSMLLEIFHLLTSSDSERIDSAQFFRNSDSRDVSRITVSTLPLTSKYPKLPEPPNQPSVLTGEIHSEDTPQNEPWTTRLRPRRPPAPSLKNGSKRRAETSSKTLKPTRRYRKNL